MTSEIESLALLFLLLLLAAAIALAFSRQFEERKRLRDQTKREREELINQPIPSEVARAMSDFLQVGSFVGEDHSPLAYVGYKVGKTQGLCPLDRQRRLKICFGIDIPQQLAAKYEGWGRPATERRYRAILNHLIMLANLRRYRASFGYAVADWEADAMWFRSQYEDTAERFRKSGYRA